VDAIIAPICIANNQVVEIPGDVMRGTSVRVPVCVHTIRNMNLLTTIVILVMARPAVTGKMAFFVANLVDGVHPW
jgi:hypothetical protein